MRLCVSNYVQLHFLRSLHFLRESGQDAFEKIAMPASKKTDVAMDLVYAELKTDSTGLAIRKTISSTRISPILDSTGGTHHSAVCE